MDTATRVRESEKERSYSRIAIRRAAAPEPTWPQHYSLLLETRQQRHLVSLIIGWRCLDPYVPIGRPHQSIAPPARDDAI